MISKKEALELLRSDISFFKEISEFSDILLQRNVSYSMNVFIPLTNACRNRCAYCYFRSDNPKLMNKKEVLNILHIGKRYNCKEALFTFGERPEMNDSIMEKLEFLGYSNVVDYLYDLCEESLNIGLLPHTNAGVIEFNELKMLREVNASMGLMLENASTRLCRKGMPHEKSPGKNPKVRIKYIKWAGKLKIPFTTGLLIGIGETYEEILGSLLVIKRIHEKYGHIQEVIIQNFKPKKGTPMENHREPSMFKMLKVVAVARLLLNTNIQVPPNLNKYWQIFIAYGANDLGGISPVTKDYINPEAPWPKIEELKKLAREININLKERLPIYPEFIEKGWFSEKVGSVIKRLCGEKHETGSS